MTLLCLLPHLEGQADQELHPPLKIPLYLSGNFGEIRPDHFHSGIDIKTQGSTGFPVHSIQDGYVSRIKVQANGYGKSIYISHPSGHTSQYGHLDRYSEEIAAYVKKVQYSRKEHQVDIYPPRDQFKVERGQIIAWSGNSGSSFGPHLHFEIRNSANQHPLNVLNFDLPVKDKTPPRFRSVYLYPLGEHSHINGKQAKQQFELIRDQGIYTVPWGSSTTAGGTIGLGVEVFDYLDGSQNRCGVYSLELYAGDILVYSHVMDEFSFSESRYVNATTDYTEEMVHDRKIHRLFRLPGDKLRIYGTLVDDGRLQLSDGQELPIRIVARDVAGNQSDAILRIKGRSPGTGTDRTGSPGKYADHTKEFTYSERDMEVRIPPHALYEDSELHFQTLVDPAAYLEKAWQVHERGTPLHSPLNLKVKIPSLDAMIAERILLASFDEARGVWTPAGGTMQDDFLEVRLKAFGRYYLCLDTIAPEVKLKDPMRENDYRGKSGIAFNVTDDLSGIDSYEGYIDNKWALFEFDPKNDLLVYYFDHERLNPGMEHELELYVKDERGNLSLYHGKFKW